MSDHNDDTKKKAHEDVDFESSIYLKDIFGSTHSLYADDPNKRRRSVSPKRTRTSSSSDDTSKATVKRTNSNNSQGQSIVNNPALRQRIKRPTGTTTMSPQETRTASSPKKLPPKKTSNAGSSPRTMQRTSSIDNPEGFSLPLSLTQKIGNRQQQQQDSTAGRTSIPHNIDIVLDEAELPNMENSTIVGNGDDLEMGHNESQASFFYDEPAVETTAKESPQQQQQRPSKVAMEVVNKPILIIESPRRIWCMGCGIFWGLMTFFGLLNGLSIAFWPPEPVLMMEEQQVQQEDVVQSPLPRPPVDVFVHMEENLIGHLPPSTIQAMKNPDSPQSMALRWFHGDPHYKTYHTARRRQRFALATLYFAANPLFEHNWKDSGHWLSYDLSECNWDRSIKMCQSKEDGVVTHLSLANNHLQGELPMAELAFLTSLQEVTLQGNMGLWGQVPTEWCSIEDLQFDCAIQSTVTKLGLCGCQQCRCMN